MDQTFYLRSRHIVSPHGVVDGVVLVEGEKIMAVQPGDPPNSAMPVRDVGDAWVFPGLVDSHVHINEPGRTEWEGFLTATSAAAAGGVTTLIEMPLNSNPVTTTPDAFRQKLAAAEGKLSVDVGFYAGLVPGNAHHVEELVRMGVFGVKAFMVYSGIPEFLNVTKNELAEAMPILNRLGIPLLAHAESDGPVDLPPGKHQSYQRYVASRPSWWETDAIGQLIELCRQTGCHVHVVHLATADALPMLATARAEGLPITVETCPHYLHFQAESIPDADTRFKCAPPIREACHREALWKALQEGALDLVVSDHSPCPPEMKYLAEGDLIRAWGGICSLQLGLSVMITECRNRGISLEHIARWMCEGPARLVGLFPRKGAIAPGADADLVVVDPGRSFTVKGRELRHRHKVTPYDHETLVGVVETTYLRGRVVYDTHHMENLLPGRVLLRSPSLA